MAQNSPQRMSYREEGKRVLVKTHFIFCSLNMFPQALFLFIAHCSLVEEAVNSPTIPPALACPDLPSVPDDLSLHLRSRSLKLVCYSEQLFVTLSSEGSEEGYRSASAYVVLLLLLLLVVVVVATVIIAAALCLCACSGNAL